MLSDYSTITGYNLQFLDHSNPDYNTRGAVERMDNYFGEFVSEATFFEMFNDGAARTQVSNDFMSILRRHVPPIVNRWTFKYERRLGRYTNLRGDVDFRKLLKKAVDSVEKEVDIYIVWGSTYMTSEKSRSRE
jgi:hypothetical protein